MIQQREGHCFLCSLKTCPGLQRDQFWSPAPSLGCLFRLAMVPGCIVFVFFMSELTGLINSVGLLMHMLQDKQNALCCLLLVVDG